MSESSSTKSSSSGTPYPITYFIKHEHFFCQNTKFIIALQKKNALKTFKQVMQREGWQKAMTTLFEALEE